MGQQETQLEKYYECKSKHSDVIFLFRVGDYYEVYERDAIDTSKILGIIVTSTELKNGSTFCLAGFPKHALDIYLTKLVRAGRRIAISE